MKNRNLSYLRKSKALKIMERATEVDLHTFLSATFAISRSRIVKNHVLDTLGQLNVPFYKLSA